MKSRVLESITKAAQCSSLLYDDILEGHKKACEDNPILSILLRELLGDAAKIKSKLEEIESCLGGDE